MSYTHCIIVIAMFQRFPRFSGLFCVNFACHQESGYENGFSLNIQRSAGVFKKKKKRRRSAGYSMALASHATSVFRHWPLPQSFSGWGAAVVRRGGGFCFPEAGSIVKRC